MCIIGENTHLAAVVGFGLHPAHIQGHAEQRRGHLLACGNQRIHLPWHRAFCTACARSIKRLVSPLMAETTTIRSCPWAPELRNLVRHLADALDRAYRNAAEF